MVIKHGTWCREGQGGAIAANGTGSSDDLKKVCFCTRLDLFSAYILPNIFLAYSSTMKMEEGFCSKTSLTVYRTTMHQVPQDSSARSELSVQLNYEYK
jgi:hypothetical protein